jgi:dTDP-4-amino-4,6-dideoxygalactose transaminase
MQIPFNSPPLVGTEIKYIEDVLKHGKVCGGYAYTDKCQKWFEVNFKCHKSLLTTSCSSALDMSAMLLDIQPGDEVIMPSFTFVSTANSFVLRGAKIVFADVRPDTMNIDESLIEGAITNKTKAIVVVHYAGVACEMDTIMAIAKKYDLYVVEDAAHGVMAQYKGQALGTIGHIGCFSFHETKNYSCGEGGLLLLNDPQFAQRAEIIREKGTNRSQFFRGQVDKYTWVDIGSSFLPSELNAACLYAQLEKADLINKNRLGSWNYYFDQFQKLADEGLIELPHIPDGCSHNAHLFFIKLKNSKVRAELIKHLGQAGIKAVFHYIPLHSSPFGKNVSRFFGKDQYTTKESDRLLRLPLFYKLTQSKRKLVVEEVFRYFGVVR